MNFSFSPKRTISTHTKHRRNIDYHPLKYHDIELDSLKACAGSQGINILPRAQGGDIRPGDILFIRSGFVEAYLALSQAQRNDLAAQKETKMSGVKSDEAVRDWIHDCYFVAVAGDQPAFEAWPPKSKLNFSNNTFRYVDEISQSCLFMRICLLSGACQLERCLTWKSWQPSVMRERTTSSSSLRRRIIVTVVWDLM